MKSKPVFSVIIPTYNRKFFLKRAIDSILMQTFKEFEIIIVDDGSTDNTKQLVDTYNDNRIVYFHIEKSGVNFARNKGIQNANGNYIAFCDSDDCWLPRKLEEHLKKYQEDDEIKVVYDLTGIVKVENGEEKIVLARNDICEGWCYKEVLEQGFLTSPTFLSCNKVCFDIIGMMPTDITNCEDDEFCFRLCRQFKIGLVKEILGVYHVDASDRISLKKKMCADDFIKFQEKWHDEVLRLCGSEVLSQRYFEAAYKYLEINEIDTAKSVYKRACEIKDTSFEDMKNKVKVKLSLNDNVIIYGTGVWGKRIYGALGLIEFFDVIFAVTDTAEAEKEFYGIKVDAIGNVSPDNNRTVIIASSDYYEEMKTFVLEQGFTHVLSYKEIINVIFDNSFVLAGQEK